MAVTPTERVERALRELGLPARIVHFDGSTRTAQDAANAVGCDLGQIVKTLFFLADGRPTMVLAAGDRQVDTALLAPLLGVGRKKLRMGSAGEVLGHTGFPVGGVSPVASTNPSDTVVDESLRRFECVWAAAGSGRAVFAAQTGELVRAVKGQWAVITRTPA
jgi:prolyl-tRNA editing enzyme YbaK/EbsC (Cys-tRNA(Pro) deacylase)